MVVFLIMRYHYTKKTPVFEPLVKRPKIYYYDSMLKKLSILVSFVVLLLVYAPSAFAVKFDLISPSGDLVQGQEVTFIINIDSQGDTINTIQTGMTYDTVPLQYVSSAAGAAMNSLTVDTTTQGTGKLLITGTNNVGFTGTGVNRNSLSHIASRSYGYPSGWSTYRNSSYNFRPRCSNRSSTNGV